MSQPDLNAFPQHLICGCCKDTGLQHLPDYPPVYRFCAKLTER